MSKINFLKPDKDNLNTFLYMGSFLFVISVIDVFLNSFFSLNVTGFLPSSLSFLIPPPEYLIIQIFHLIFYLVILF